MQGWLQGEPHRAGSVKDRDLSRRISTPDQLGYSLCNLLRLNFHRSVATNDHLAGVLGDRLAVLFTARAVVPDQSAGGRDDLVAER